MQFTPGSLPFGRPNPDVYSDTEERDQGIPIPANRAFPEEDYPKDFIGGDHFANATFPGAHRNLRGLRRTNALHSGLPRSNRDFDHGPGRSDEMIDLRKPDHGSVPHRDAAAWEGGRLADRTGITEQPFRDSPRYRPYGKEADRTLTNSRLCCQPQALPDHHRYQSHGSTTRNNRRSSNSTEEGEETLYDREDDRKHDSPRNPPSYPPKHSRQVIDAMLQLYIKNLPEPERKAFYQEIASSVNQPESALKTDLVPADPVNAPTGKVIGLLPAPVIQHPDDSDDLAEAGEVDFERVEDALRQLTIVVNSSKVKYDDETSAVMDWFQPLLDKLNGSTINTHLNTWHDSEEMLHETIINLTAKALAKAVELKEKALVQLDAIDAAETEKLRIIEVAREEFKKILSGQRAELGLLEARFEEKTKALRKKAEKLLTTDEISAEALANVNRRQSTKPKARR